MASAAKRGRNEPVEPPKIVIVKKIVGEGHGGHHGGAWKVAYADFVTAMMAFFLLLWILGATTEKQRKGIADYFSPTLVEMREKSAGSNGPFGGDSIISKDHYAHRASQTGSKSITVPKDASGGAKEGAAAIRSRDRVRFQMLKQKLQQQMKANKATNNLDQHVRFTETPEGLRIDIVDGADFSMFALGSDQLVSRAQQLIAEVSQTIATVPNGVIVRGHTDGLPYAAGRQVNNWTLSSARAEATRKALSLGGVGNDRFLRIEGVADREPYQGAADAYDPRNRRMSITLAWTDGGADEGEVKAMQAQIGGGASSGGANDPGPEDQPRGFIAH
ncbi:OmpA family protein [Sphingomonas sp. CGMCC 1.13654]|uniref:OmpA family protein n=1 Tax=Sphingomonas chungangi TaxID=2683589 RepID=A0A838L1W4_9SPHN|nr:flagellar motor protein MotB [Sphingomonas chungangi]MBA2932920.1 OmpA family protein [Sphingomonas chungangi]MVW56540.1 OmpA family protein [Sphingomonas chungangi]